MKTNPDPIKQLMLIDPILATVIKKVPVPKWQPQSNYFRALVEAIINQQLSEKAADTITTRFIGLFPDSTFPTPQFVLQIPDDTIRTAGISYAKIAYIKDLAQKCIDNTLQFEQIHTFSDEEVITHLTQVKGIGRWSAEMFLMFAMCRPDIFSYGDLGLRNAMQKLYKLKKPPSLKKAQQISYKWRPYRSWACRYLWMSLDIR